MQPPYPVPDEAPVYVEEKVTRKRTKSLIHRGHLSQMTSASSCGHVCVSE